MAKQQQPSWSIEFFRRVSPTARPQVPAEDFLNTCPEEVTAEFMATLDAVREASPPSFSGGLRWQVMRGEMGGWYEVRTKHGKRLYRLFCLLDRNGPGLAGPSIVLVAGGVKGSETAFTKRFYAQVRRLGQEYLASDPRSVAR